MSAEEIQLVQLEVRVDEPGVSVQPLRPFGHEIFPKLLLELGIVSPGLVFTSAWILFFSLRVNKAQVWLRPSRLIIKLIRGLFQRLLCHHLGYQI